MTSLQESGVGYDSVITRRSHYDGMGVSIDWHVQTTRRSDGKSIVAIFNWRWRARRFARSSRRIGRAFERWDTHMSIETEHIAIDLETGIVG